MALMYVKAFNVHVKHAVGANLGHSFIQFAIDFPCTLSVVTSILLFLMLDRIDYTTEVMIVLSFLQRLRAAFCYLCFLIPTDSCA